MPAVLPQAQDALARVHAILFDLDGVLTPTLDLHVAAWSLLFSPYLRDRGARPYSDEDYFLYIDGRPRIDGVRALLASRGIDRPLGRPDDPADADTVWGLGNRKNEVFWKALSERGIRPYPGSVDFLDRARAAGYRVGVVSSSRNAVPVLEAAGIRDRFEVIVDGLLAAERQLSGKPSPDTYRYGADLLGVDPADCAVVEDAVSGVQAAHTGGFGLVIGVDRGVGRAPLSDAGADVVVTDLAELASTLRHGNSVTEGRR